MAPEEAHPHNPATPLKQGDKVGSYTIIEQIGIGGSSIVYRAKDQLLNREVAVKQIRHTSGTIDDELREQVKHEAQLQKQAAAKSPRHLVALIETIDLPHGLFLISEFVNGPSLEQVLAQNTEPMDLKQALGIIAATARALHDLHSQDIIHRDLKPANILLPREGGLKISDFGLASSMARQQVLTVGSVRYMAPELLRDETADGRADLYSLGIIAYEMIAGRKQFDQAFRMVLRDQRNQAMRWMKWHTNPRAVAPPLTQLRPDVSESIAELIARVMDKDVARRVPSAADLIEAIRRNFAEPQAAPRQTTALAVNPTVTSVTVPGDTAQLPARSQWPLIITVMLAGWLVIGLGTGGYLYYTNAREATELQQQAIAVLDQARDAYEQGEYQASQETFASLIGDWPADTNVGRHARAGALRAQGQLDLAEGRYEDARQAFRDLELLDVDDRDQVRRFIDEAEQRQAFAAGMRQLDQAIEQRDFAQARRLLRQWSELTLTSHEEEQLNALATRLEDQLTQQQRQTVLTRAQEQLQAGQRSAAIATLRAALEQSPHTQLQQRYDELVADQRYDQAVADARAAERAGNLDQAIRAFERAYDIQPNEQVLGQLNAARSQVALESALRLLAEGRTTEAEVALTRSLGYGDNVRAREELNRLAGSARRQAFTRAGDEAMHANDFATAVIQYRNALSVEGLDPDAGLRDKLLEARVQHELTRGLQEMRSGNIAQAERHLRDAERMAADSPAVSSALEQFRTRQEYYQHLAAGDEARARSEFGNAKRSYRRAQAIINTPEIRQRLTDTDYDQYLAQARTNIARQEYASARALLIQAADIQPSEEIRQMLQQIYDLETGQTP